MAILSRITRGFRALVGRRKVERDLDDELGAYLNAAIDEKIARGMPRDQAIRTARRELGSAAAVKDYTRDAGWETVVESLWLDIRLAGRTLRKNPGFAAIAVLTLTLGIGANTAVFTLLDAVLLKPLPVPAPHELVMLYETAPDVAPDATGGSGRYLRFSYPRFERLAKAVEGRAALAAFTRTAPFLIRVPGASNTHRVRGQLVSENFFQVLGLTAARGLVLDRGDASATSPSVVVSDRFWRQSLDASDAVVGQTVIVNGVTATIVGVAPAGFFGVWTDAGTDLWIPLRWQAALGYRNNASSYGQVDSNQPWMLQDHISWLTLIGRVPDRDRGATFDRLQTVNREALADSASTLGESSRREFLRLSLVIEPFTQGFSGLRGQYTRALVALASIVGVVLLVTCANIANLLLARAARRERDIAVRRSLGATTGRIVQQLVAENLLLALFGGVAGVFLGEWGSGLLARQALGTTGDLPPAFSPDSRVLVFGVVVSVATVLLCSVIPAFRARWSGEASLLTAERASTDGHAVRGMRPIVAFQIALSVVVVVVASLLGRTLVNYVRIDPGFKPAGLVGISFDIPASELSADRMAALPRRLGAVVSAVPGVRSASMSVCGLIENCSYGTSARIDRLEREISVRQNWVGAQYFSTAGIVVTVGREFGDQDTAQSARVAVVTESVVQRFLSGRNPIGWHVEVNGTDAEIVGVVNDVRSVSVRDLPNPMIYFPIEQPPRQATTLRVFPNRLDIRVDGDAARLAPILRDAIRRAEPAMVVFEAVPMSSRLSRDLGRERLVAVLASTFAGLALLLASVGLYGVLSYMVASRGKEIGVRMALGADRLQVVGLVVRQGAVLTLVGIVAGLAGAATVTRYLTGMLFEVTPLDPFTFTAAAGVFASVAALASYLPARRATRVDPLTALRAE